MSTLGHYNIGDTLTPDDAAHVRDIVNCIIAGTLPQGQDQSVCLRSCHDLGEHGCGPKHVVCIRVFDVMLAVSNPIPCDALIRLVADEPGSDHIRVPIDTGLGAVARIEHVLGGVSGVAHDLGNGTVLRRHALEHREVLGESVTQVNAWVDEIRALAEQPSSWPPISKLAPLRAVLIELRRDAETSASGGKAE